MPLTRLFHKSSSSSQDSWNTHRPNFKTRKEGKKEEGREESRGGLNTSKQNFVLFLFVSQVQRVKSLTLHASNIMAGPLKVALLLATHSIPSLTAFQLALATILICVWVFSLKIPNVFCAHILILQVGFYIINFLLVALSTMIQRATQAALCAFRLPSSCWPIS